MFKRLNPAEMGRKLAIAKDGQAFRSKMDGGVGQDKEYFYIFEMKSVELDLQTSKPLGLNWVLRLFQK